MNTTTADQQRQDNYQWRRQTPMMTNKGQTTIARRWSEPTSQRSTGTADATNTTRRDFINFHPKTSSSISFDSQNKTKDKKRCSPKYKVLSPTIQLDKKHKMLYAHFVSTCTKLTHCWTTEWSKVQSQKQNFKKTTAHPDALIQETPAPDFKIEIAKENLAKVTKQVLVRIF